MRVRFAAIAARLADKGPAGLARRACLVAAVASLAAACQSAAPVAEPAGTTSTIGETTVTTSGRVRVETGFVE